VLLLLRSQAPKSGPGSNCQEGHSICTCYVCPSKGRARTRNDDDTAAAAAAAAGGGLGVGRPRYARTQHSRAVPDSAELETQAKPGPFWQTPRTDNAVWTNATD
jgi:hypothetical protein